MAGGGVPRVKLAKAPVLLKFLDNDNLVTFRQHWVNPGGNAKGDRPYLCRGTGCPLCKISLRSSQAVLYNVLQLSGGEPSNKVLMIGVKADESLIDQGSDAKGKLRISDGFWAVNRSGKGTSSQTNFQPVKERDLEDDWDEIYEYFDPDDLDDVIAEAQEHKFDPGEVVQETPLHELKQLARHLASDEDDEDDEDDDEDG
jgi:hypothetical protein